MIFDALSVIKDELIEYLNGFESDPGEAPVVLGNIAFLENNPGSASGESNIENKVVLSIVNVEEEKRLKNTPTVRTIGIDSEYINPPVFINLYLLFSANFTQYDNSLKMLSRVIEFFQGKKYFTPSNSPGLGQGMELHMEIHTLNFEQINDLWGSLGGKQLPFVMYKMRNLKMERPTLLQISPAITDISEEGQVT